MATIHLYFFAIRFFEIQEPGSPFVSVILHILLIATLAGPMRRLAGLLVSLAIQSPSFFKIILGPLIRERKKAEY